MPRRKSFDPDAALDRAMAVFQAKGYAGASVADLLAGMGINRFSMYDTFGDKHALYLAALDRYADRVVSENLRPIESPESTLDDLERWLVQTAASPREGRCCLVLRTVIETGPTDAEAAARAARVNQRVASAIRNILTRAQREGRLREGVDPDAAATSLHAFHAGLPASGLAETPRRLRAAVRHQIDALRE